MPWNFRVALALAFALAMSGIAGAQSTDPSRVTFVQVNAPKADLTLSLASSPGDRMRS